MKTLVVEIDFEEETKGAVASVSSALGEFEISRIGWKEKPATTWAHRTAASTARNALEGG